MHREIENSNIDLGGGTCRHVLIQNKTNQNHTRPKRARDCNNYCIFDVQKIYITKMYFKMKFTCLFDCVYCFCCYFAVIIFFKRFTVDGCDESLVYICTHIKYIIIKYILLHTSNIQQLPRSRARLGRLWSLESLLARQSLPICFCI